MRALIVATLLISGVAQAQSDPKFEHRAVGPTKEKAEWKANLTFGLLFVDGNAFSLGLSGTGLFGVKFRDNAFELFGQGAYGLTGTSTVKNGPIDGTAESAR